MALLLKEVNRAPLSRNALWLPLTLACLISEYSRLVFPIKSSTSRIIDAAFDEALKYLGLGRHKTLKEFVTNSKGIQYAKDPTMRESARMLERAAFILTTDENIEETALKKRLPYAFIFRPSGKGLHVRAQYHDGNYYEQLKRNLPGWIEVSLQAVSLAGTTRLNNPIASSEAQGPPHNSSVIASGIPAARSLGRYQEYLKENACLRRLII